MKSHIILYSFADFDRSSRVRWLLNELNLEYSETRIRYGDQYKKEYRAINPVSRVPCIEIHGKVIFESGAIFTYLLQKTQDNNLIPTGVKDYPNYLSWFFFLCSEFDAKMANVMKLYLRGHDVDKIQKEHQKLIPLLNILENKLSNRKFLVGNKFSACDIFLSSQLALLNKTNLIKGFPNLVKYLSHHAMRVPAKKAKVFTSEVKRIKKSQPA